MNSRTVMDGTKGEALARLRREIARLEASGAAGAGTDPRPITLGLDAVDGHLPGGGLAVGALHEIVAGDGSAAAMGFALFLIRRLRRIQPRPWLWCLRDALPYGPALADFGLDLADLLVACCTSDRVLLWALEEGLASPALGTVMGEAVTLSATAGRRLALAARSHGVTALLLRPAGAAPGPSFAATRWRIRSLPLPEHPEAPPGVLPAACAWDATLLRGRGAMPRRWAIAWSPESGPALLSVPPRPEERRHAGNDAEDPESTLPLAAPFRGGTHRRPA